MDARDGRSLTASDIAKIIARKFYRLAVPYYLMWIILWSVTSRVGQGPIWANTRVTFETCSNTWIYTLLFVGNLLPNEMSPYQGCF